MISGLSAYGHIELSTDPDTYECSGCMAECDEIEEPPIVLNGHPLCHGCRELCGGDCGEWLTDDTIRESGPIVSFRDPAMNGKVIHAHALCAGLYLITLSVPGLYLDADSSREEIEEALHAEVLQ